MKFHEPLPKPRVEAIEIIDFNISVKPIILSTWINKGEVHPVTKKVYRTRRKHTFPFISTDITIKFKSKILRVGDFFTLDTHMQFCVTSRVEDLCIALNATATNSSIEIKTKHEVALLYSGSSN